MRARKDSLSQEVRARKENQRRGTKKRNKEKPPASIEGKMILAGGERFFAYAQNDRLVGR